MTPKPVPTPRPIPAPRQPEPHAAELTRLAAELKRLTPCWNNPELFHLRKSMLIHEMNRLARTLERTRA